MNARLGPVRNPRNRRHKSETEMSQGIRATDPKAALERDPKKKEIFP